MQVLRPISPDDLPGLVALARSIDGGLTTLPADEAFLQDRIDEAVRAFSPSIKKPAGEFYLFVLEDVSTRAILGTSGILSRVGGFDPFYSYEIRTERLVHAPLKIEKEMSVLHLKKTHRGPSEICSLFLRADARRGGLGRLLSLGRFLFMAAFPKRFDTTVIAELRGYIDQQGKSPFWEAVGRHFFDYDFYTADFLSGTGNKEFIADLMPQHPIYLSLLPAAVQAVIGKVHHDTQPALSLLEAEGFSATTEVDIFDAGPQVRAETKQVRTVRAARAATLVETTPESPPPRASHLLSNGRLDFRATLGSPRMLEADTLSLPVDLADALDVKVGDKVFFSPIK